MNKFIKLSDSKKREIYVSIDKIETIYKNSNGKTVVSFNDVGFEYVVESPEEIIEMINKVNENGKS